MQTERFEFKGADGQSLAARLELPANRDPIAYALFAHCFTCSKNVKAAVKLTRALSEQGIGVVRFDFTGLGESEGDFADTNFSSNVGDLIAAALYMEQELQPPQLLVGHSLGGAAVLHAAGALESVQAIATLGAPSDASHVLRHIASAREEIEATGKALVSIGGRPFTVKRQFLEDLEAHNMNAALEGLGRALLILHAPLDDVVGIENASTLYGLAKHPKSFISLDRADHMLSDARDSTWVGRLLAAWAPRYMTEL